MTDDTTTTDDPTTATPDRPTRRRRRPGGLPLEDVAITIDALADFVRALERMQPPAQRAAVAWLADRYLDRA